MQNYAPEIGIGHDQPRPQIQDYTPETFDIPASCCVNPDSPSCRSATVSIAALARINPGDIYEEGCSSALTKFLEGHVIYLIGMGGGVLIIELIGMIFSLCLCCALKRIDDFKA